MLRWVRNFLQWFILKLVVLAALLILNAGRSTNSLNHCEIQSTFTGQSQWSQWRPSRVYMAAPLSVCTKEELRAVMWILWAESKSGAELYRRFLSQYVNSALLQQSEYEWITMFKHGSTSVAYEETSGRPYASTTEERIPWLSIIDGCLSIELTINCVSVMVPLMESLKADLAIIKVVEDVFRNTREYPRKRLTI
jgi:hypothetical protein